MDGPSHHDQNRTSEELPPPPYSLYDELGSALTDGSGTVLSDNGRINIHLDSKVERTLSRFIDLRPNYEQNFDHESKQKHYRHLQAQQDPPSIPNSCAGIAATPPDEPFHVPFPLPLNIVIQIVGSRGDVQPFVALGTALKRHGHRVRIATHNVFANFVQESGLEFYPIGVDPADLMAFMVKNPGLIPEMKTLREGEVQKKRAMIATVLDGCWQSCIRDDPVTNEPFVADAIIANPPSFAHVHCAQALGIPVHIMFTMPTDNGQTFPKPRDWPAHIDVCGFFFRDTPVYQPPPELERFLKSGPPPVYIGFGSIVVDDPLKLINTVVDAVGEAGVRAVISRGWSNIVGPPNTNIYYIDDCPHEWLFRHVAAVVHHGGAGTTACGLRNGRPTVVVPFFGDQPFWGNMVAAAGAGPSPIPHASLDAENLTAAIRFCLRSETASAAQTLARKMQNESGVTAAVNSFHRHLPLDRMRCCVLPDQAAVWQYTKGSNRVLRLSKPALETLLQLGKIDVKKIQCYEPNPIHIENRRWDPLTGSLSSVTATGTNMIQGAGEMLYNPATNGNTDDSNSDISSRAYKSNGLATAGNMAAGTLKGFGKFTGGYFKGVTVDLPHAAAEGFRQVPRLYGEQPKDYGPVRDWKSGAIVGGRNFVEGMADGVAGLFVKPVKGAIEEGALGAIKGFAKGSIGLATKVPSAGIGLVAYPLHGITKSIESAFRSKTRKAVVHARLRDGSRQTYKMHLTPEQQGQIANKYDSL
ncbi:hypothetical protein SBRCBS47491_004689 [Sporothrix bragantina]|uniref:Glycosyltransferase family 28 N-terminal domain-containing protein n=1 Tax=Sporothrix bragantina TaxID=671064 RepID=A0ABP0BQW4_9PEZI